MQAPLTEYEIQSLARLRTPRQLLRQLPAARLCCSDPIETGTRPIDVRFLVRRIVARNANHPLMEAELLYRHESIRQVVVAVGEKLSLAHRPGYWTSWRSSQKSYFQLTARGVCCRTALAVNIAFPGILPERFQRMLTWKLVVPSFPPPLCEQRRIRELYEP